ncbi:MAG: hypothetical protein ACFCU2_11710 [Acidimicrobiia bacterium]
MTEERNLGGQTPDHRKRKIPVARRLLPHLRGGNPILGRVETGARSLRNAAAFHLAKPVRRRDFFARSIHGSERLGVYGVGGCDVRTIVGSGPMVANDWQGSVCVGSFWGGPTRSDLLVQTIQPPPREHTAEVSEKLELSDYYFEPRLFEAGFSVPGQIGLGRWPKDVIVLSISSDVGRTLYRHKEHGFLVDPGGWWLEADMKEVLGDLGKVKWFAANFAKASRIEVGESMKNFESIISEVRQRIGAYVVVLNLLTVDPGKVALDYKHANSPNRMRRREFYDAIAHLGHRMDFPVLDVDHITKELGISGQADFVHYTPPQTRAISREFAGLLRDAGVTRRPESAGDR